MDDDMATAAKVNDDMTADIDDYVAADVDDEIIILQPIYLLMGQHQKCVN